MGGGGQIVACTERVIIAGCTLACSRFTSTDDFAAANIPQNGRLVMILWHRMLDRCLGYGQK